MEKLRKKINLIMLVGSCVILGGCSMLGIGRYYNDKSDAKKVALQLVEKQYDKKFTIQGKGTFKQEKSPFGNKKIEVYHAQIQDEDGLNANISVSEEKKYGWSDTYSEVVYTKKTREEIEPLFKNEPFKKYYIELQSAGLSKNDISLSANDYFKETGDEYMLFVILEDNKDATYYADIIAPFYEKLSKKQHNTFGLTFYANNIEIYSVSFVDSKGFNADVSYEDILSNVKAGLMGHQPQPEEQFLKSEYYNGE